MVAGGVRGQVRSASHLRRGDRAGGGESHVADAGQVGQGLEGPSRGPFALGRAEVEIESIAASLIPKMIGRIIAAAARISIPVNTGCAPEEIACVSLTALLYSCDRIGSRFEKEAGQWESCMHFG